MQFKPILVGMFVVGALATAIPLVHATSKSLPINDLKVVAETNELTKATSSAYREEYRRREGEHRRREHHERRRREWSFGAERNNAASFPSPQLALNE